MEILKCTGIKEIVKPGTHMLLQFYLYKRLSENELNIIGSHLFIAVQSEWSQRSIGSINPRAQIFKSLRPLREEFVSARQAWSPQSTGKIFISAAGLHSFKGLHIAFKSLKLLIDNGIEVSLNIAGGHSKGIRQRQQQRRQQQMPLLLHHPPPLHHK